MSVQVPHVPATALPERLPGEPPLPDAGPGAIAAALVGQALLLGLLSVVVFPWWVVYLVARWFRPRPPNLASLRRTLHVLRLILTEQPPAPGLSVTARSLLLLSVVKRWLLVPVWGLAWYLDELWFGRALAQVAIVAPLFELSAARSGSTQLARYLGGRPPHRRADLPSGDVSVSVAVADGAGNARPAALTGPGARAHGAAVPPGLDPAPRAGIRSAPTPSRSCSSTSSSVTSPSASGPASQWPTWEPPA